MTDCYHCLDTVATTTHGGHPSCTDCATAEYETLWDRIPDRFVSENPVGEKYLRPSKEGIEKHASWMVDEPRWFTWTWSNTGQKIPHRGDDPRQRTSWQDVEAQVDFQTAWENYINHGHAGVGFGFTSDQDIILEDFDNVINPGEDAVDDPSLDNALREDSEPAFFSSSGTGAHRYPVAPDASNTSRHPHEVYTTERFAAVTGHIINAGMGPEHGEDLSGRVDAISGMFNQSSGSGASLGDIEFDADPVKLDDDDWECPEALADQGECVRSLVYAISTHDPLDDDGAGWGQNTFGRYSYLIMLLAQNQYGDAGEIAEALASFESPAIRAAQEGKHFKKPAMPKPNGLGVPWDLGYQCAVISSKIQSGDLTAPAVSTVEENTNISIGNECSCIHHGGNGAEEWHVDLELTEQMKGAGNENMLWELRNDYQTQMMRAVDEGVSGHLVGPKGVGKTYNLVELARRAEDTGKQVLALVPTKHKYNELMAEAEEKDVSVLRLPSFPEHSPLWDEWESEYLRGAFPREIYTWDDRDSDDMPQDEYKRRQDLDLDEYDLLLGAPQHAFVQSVVEDRVVLFDDAELSAYRQTLDRDTKDDINHLLEELSVEQNSWKELDGAAWGPIERAIARRVSGSTATGQGVWDQLDADADSDDGIDRRAFLARLPGVNLNTIDWIRALTGDLHHSEEYEDRGMRIVEAEGMKMLVNAPDMTGAEQLFTMGAVPAEEQLQVAFDDMGVEYEGMYGSARHGEMEKAINRFVIQTSSNVHNKTKDHANTERMAELAGGLERLGREADIDEPVQMFSTLHEAAEIARERGYDVKSGKDLKAVEGVANYGSLIGSNEYKNKHLGVVGASQHFGDNHVKLEAAYAGALPQDPEDDGPYTPRRWSDPTHAAIERRMRQSGAYEAITRMGRSDTELTLVISDTAEMPEYLQCVDQSSRVGHFAKSRIDVYEVIKNNPGMAAKDGNGGGICAMLDQYSAPTIYNAISELVEEGLVGAVGNGKYNCTEYELVEPDEPIREDILGFSIPDLTGSAFKPAVNPDWDVNRFETAADDTMLTTQASINQFWASD